MNQTYLNCPSTGRAISAEEFAAGLSKPGSCGSCPTPAPCSQQSQVVCCCQTVPIPAPNPPTVEEGCCCKQSFRAALGLLCDPEVAGLLDFEQTAFFTDHYIAGAAVTETTAAIGPSDNLTPPLAGVFRRFSPCCLDLLDAAAPLFAAPDTATGLTSSQINLCELTAVAIQLAPTTAEGELTAEQVAQRNIRRIRRILSRGMASCTCPGSSCTCPVPDQDGCCCASGLLSALAENNFSRRVSLAAGPLLLNGVTLVGNVGNVLVLVNETALRFYFVCVNHIEFIA